MRISLKGKGLWATARQSVRATWLVTTRVVTPALALLAATAANCVVCVPHRCPRHN